MVRRALVPRILAFVLGAAALVLGQSVGHGLGAASADADRADVAVTQQVAPAWTLSDVAAFPGCVAQAAWPGGTPARSVVVDSATGHRRIGFDRAWAQNHNATSADDRWILGVCR